MLKAPTRIRLLLWLLIVTPLGFLFKLYTGPGRWWFNDYGAGTLYEIFWILSAFYLFPSRKTVYKIPIWIFTITSFIEILQLWNPLILEKLRSYFIGSILLGTTFVWWDFPHYILGCSIGWLIIDRLCKNSSINCGTRTHD